MEITGTFKDALSRQAEEAVRIQARKPSESMNSKSQLKHPPIARIVLEKRDYYGTRTQNSPGL